jgi:hypothetical protein
VLFRSKSARSSPYSKIMAIMMVPLFLNMAMIVLILAMVL